MKTHAPNRVIARLRESLYIKEIAYKQAAVKYGNDTSVQQAKEEFGQAAKSLFAAYIAANYATPTAARMMIILLVQPDYYHVKGQGIRQYVFCNNVVFAASKANLVNVMREFMRDITPYVIFSHSHPAAKAGDSVFFYTTV